MDFTGWPRSFMKVITAGRNDLETDKFETQAKLGPEKGLLPSQ